jgi:hypothetical protein
MRGYSQNLEGNVMELSLCTISSLVGGVQFVFRATSMSGYESYALVHIVLGISSDSTVI